MLADVRDLGVLRLCAKQGIRCAATFAGAKGDCGAEAWILAPVGVQRLRAEHGICAATFAGAKGDDGRLTQLLVQCGLAVRGYRESSPAVRWCNNRRNAEALSGHENVRWRPNVPLAPSAPRPLHTGRA